MEKSINRAKGLLRESDKAIEHLEKVIKEKTLH